MNSSSNIKSIFDSDKFVTSNEVEFSSDLQQKQCNSGGTKYEHLFPAKLFLTYTQRGQKIFKKSERCRTHS